MLESTGKSVKRVFSTGDETPSLPEDLIFEILLRVPVRSLMQFKCVSKSWKTLISDPQFAKDHIRPSIAHPNMSQLHLFCPVIGMGKMVSDSVQSLLQNPSTPVQGHFFNMDDKDNRILGSCYGLLCLVVNRQKYVKLWNPSIRVTSKRFSTGIDTSTSSAYITHHGFGYDHVNDKYKLLVATEVSRYHGTVTKLFTFGTNSWRVIQNFPCWPTRSQGKFVRLNSTLNWIAKRGASNDDPWMIFSLDLVTETYGEVLLPDEDGAKIYFPVVDVLRDCLCVSFYDSKTDHWVVWLMKEYGVQCSWIKLMTIPSFIKRDCTWNDLMWRKENVSPFRIGHGLVPLYISEDGVVIFEAHVWKVVLYNLNDRRVVDYPRISAELGFQNLHLYHESLVSPLC